MLMHNLLNSLFNRIRNLCHDVYFGSNTLIRDSDWHLSDTRSAEPRPVHIGDNVWLGYGFVAMKGVSIGKNSVIAVGSIVTKDIPPNVVAAGNPCKVIKQIGLADKQ